MNPVILGVIIRTALQLAGGALIAKGAANSEDVSTIVNNSDTIAGALLAAGSFGWSIAQKVMQKREVVKAATTGEVSPSVQKEIDKQTEKGVETK